METVSVITSTEMLMQFSGILNLSTNVDDMKLNWEPLAKRTQQSCAALHMSSTCMTEVDESTKLL